jgi:carboxypeptidase PM20D1
MLKKILPFVIFIMLVFSAVVLYKTISLKTKQISVEEIEERKIKESAIQHLAEAVRINTVAETKYSEIDSASFDQFLRLLESSYPAVEERLEKRIFNQFSSLYKWPGRTEQLKPILLLAHIDVFPVPQGQILEWNVPPFSGEITSGALWGRGTLHGKVAVVGILEAIETLLKEGFAPERTIYLALGHDKTTGGLLGAKAMASHLQAVGIEPGLVIDEGYSISRGLVPGILTDVARIGISETGFASFELRIDRGKASSSELQQMLTTVARDRAIDRLRDNPMPPQITSSVKQFLDFAGPEMRFRTKMLYANKYLFRSAIISIFQESVSASGKVQTGMVPSLLDMGIIEHMDSTAAFATINYRILPGSSIEDVKKKVTETINDERLRVSLMPLSGNPIMTSPVDGWEYRFINQSIREIFPYVICLPDLYTSVTDSRYFNETCNYIYRFSPVRLNPENNQSIHGVNEHIPIEEFNEVVRFYIRLIENSSGMDNI